MFHDGNSGSLLEASESAQAQEKSFGRQWLEKTLMMYSLDAKGRIQV
jgi:hypothetical protein